MDHNTILKVEHVSKKFTRSLRRAMLYASYDVLKSLNPFYKEDPKHPIKLRRGEFLVLDDISFELKQGDSLGLVGINGSGKTTLLRLIYGIYPFDRGVIHFRGRMGALLAAGVGFHPHMTGRENIYVNGTILGMTRNEISERIEQIVEFADIAQFIDAPSATYSSGMRVRLGFSIAVHADVNILIADEILAVGDAAFRDKCFAKIKELQNQGVSVIFVAHFPEMIRQVCNKCLFLEKGRIKAYGDVNEVLMLYEKELADKKSCH
jgi:lipopolysaccharide transport system ATP-binding protein